MQEEDLRTIIVTGSNKGIGFGIIKNLAAKPYHIIMGCRSTEKANKAKSQILEVYPKAKIDVLELDLNNEHSIKQFVANINKQYGQVDILLNNSGMAFKGDEFSPEIVKKTFQTNFYGTVDLTEQMIPNIKESGKIIFVGSSTGKLKLVKSPKLLEQYQKPDLTKEELFALAEQFYQDVKDDIYIEKGWSKQAYGFSKLNINIFASILSRYDIIKDFQIQVYTCNPGWTRTDMAGEDAKLSIEEGAECPVYLVELPFIVNPEYQGKYFDDKKVSSL